MPDMIDRPIINGMQSLFSFLAERRWVGVGLALVVEGCVLVALSLAPSSGEAGIPAAVAVGIAGTVAVVFGVVDGVLLAVVGALLFAALEGWSVDDLAPLALWPCIVGAVALFARRVARSRTVFQQVVSEHEHERKRLALELHDQQAQALVGAQMMLRAAGHAEGDSSAAASAHARELINDTISALRALAVNLSPKALEDYGLRPAVKQLAATLSNTAGVSINVGGDWSDRISPEAELVLYRVVQGLLTTLIADGERELSLSVGREHDTIVVAIEHGGRCNPRRDDAHQALRERVHLLGGRLRILPSAAGGTRLQVELPAGA
jgi:signal transduction histidine kinase